MKTVADNTTTIRDLSEKRKRLIDAFLAREERDLCSGLAGILDEYFRDSFSRSTVGPRLHVEKNPCAFIALGGYGRMEQCIRSDVDVLLLFGKRVPPEAEDLLRETVYPLWDLGFDVGHATRTLKECRTLASEDFDLLTPLLDARFLCGFSPLFSELLQSVRQGILAKNKLVFLDWLVRRCRERHERYGDSSYLLEPDIKEGQGGLRDYHAIGWMAMACYRTHDVTDLVRGGRIGREDADRLHEALLFIREVRNRLHHTTNRRCDRLYFEAQVDMARSMGFGDWNGRPGVERYLGTLHGHMEAIKQLHLGFVDSVAAPRGFSFRKGPAPRLGTPGLKWAKDTIGFESADSITRNPLLLTRIFERSSGLGVSISVEAKRLVREHLGLVCHDLRTCPEVIEDLRRILTAGTESRGALQEMFQTGLMSALIPEIKGIVNLIQYDTYHAFPVDMHSLRTVEILKEMGRPESGRRSDLLPHLYAEVQDPETLLWAALFHDIGKGEAVKDHAVQGADMARGILSRMSFPEEKVERVSFLVREHLCLHKTATQRNLQEEKTVVAFARKFRNLDELTMLYLLTVADAMATGPKAWGAWVDTLLRELYFKARHILERGELASAGTAALVARKRREVAERALDISREDLDFLFEKMSPRYLLYTPSEDILRHVVLFRRLDRMDVVLDARKTENEYRTVTVCARDRPGLFSKISGVFTLNNLDILDARIHTWANEVALDIFVVKPPPDPFHEEETWQRVLRDLTASLSGDLSLEAAIVNKIRSRTVSRRGISKRPEKVVVDSEASDFFTIIEVYANDSPGLLFRITHALFQLELDVRVAKITTKVDQALDVFYVRDMWGQKVSGEHRASEIRNAILAALPIDQVPAGAGTNDSVGDGPPYPTKV